ncbi:unnamed protein product, partial [Acidithrix sp. C25]
VWKFGVNRKYGSHPLTPLSSDQLMTTKTIDKAREDRKH